MSASQTAPSPKDHRDECAQCPDGCAPHPSGLHPDAATASPTSIALTPRMRVVLGATAIVVAVGLAAGAWLLWAAPTPPAAVPAASTAPVGGPAPGAAPASGSEVLPPADQPEQQQLSDRLPPREAFTPRVTTPLPATADAQGGIVDGFPADIAAPLEGADVIDTSVASEGTVLQFSLRARTSSGAADVLAYYAQRWAGLGLAPAGASDTEPSYRDDFSSVTVSTEQSGTGTIFTVFGVLRAE